MGYSPRHTAGSLCRVVGLPSATGSGGDAASGWAALKREEDRREIQRTKRCRGKTASVTSPHTRLLQRYAESNSYFLIAL